MRHTRCRGAPRKRSLRRGGKSIPTSSSSPKRWGGPLEQIAQLGSSGFSYFFNSAKWWDFHGNWLLEQYEQFRHIAPSIAFPESHDTDRLAAMNGGEDRQSRLWYLFTAFFSAGVMMPVGYEFGFRKKLHVVETRPNHWERGERCRRSPPGAGRTTASLFRDVQAGSGQRERDGNRGPGRKRRGATDRGSGNGGLRGVAGPRAATGVVEPAGKHLRHTIPPQRRRHGRSRPRSSLATKPS